MRLGAHTGRRLPEWALRLGSGFLPWAIERAISHTKTSRAGSVVPRAHALGAAQMNRLGSVADLSICNLNSP